MIYLTVVNSSGGGHGHQLKDLVGGLTIARMFNFQYVHSENNYLDFFAIGEGEIKYHEISIDNIDIMTLPGPAYDGVRFRILMNTFSSLEKKYQDKDCMIVIEKALRVHPCQTISWFKNGFITKNIFSEISTELSYKFSKKHQAKPALFDPEKINIAVHIRRGEEYTNPEFHKNHTFPQYMFSIKYYKNIIASLAVHFQQSDYQIHIFTEQTNSDEIISTFGGLNNISLHIGESRHKNNFHEVENAFLHMVKSDVLVTCNSSLSVVASYFRNSGLTIYHPHIHLYDLPGNRFISTDTDGVINNNHLSTVF